MKVDRVPENQNDCDAILFEKFAELSKYFSEIINNNCIEPELKCCVIQSMISIYEAIYGLQ